MEFLCAFWLCEFQLEKENSFLDFCSSLEVWDDWREMGLLAAGYLARTARGDQVLPWLQTLVPASPPRTAKKADPRIIAAAEMLLEIGKRNVVNVPSGQNLWQGTRNTLRQLVHNGWLSPAVRARAGRALGWIGDDRPGVMDFSGIDQADSGFWSTVIAPGPFAMGNDRAHGGHSDERPRHLCADITETYAISRHLITVAQYAAFWKAGGYQDQRWWGGRQGGIG